MNATFAVYPKIFPIQSYLDNAAGAQALLLQARGAGIVLADQQADVKGTFVGLHPDSQTPIAFRPLTVDGRVGGQTIVLVPGQVMRLGINGFEWGLPYGWLGGGLATLVVANNEKAFVNWPQAKVEVLLHRLRGVVQADAAPAGLTFTASFPNRFPWPQAQRANTSQAGQPILAPEPTRVALRLRLNNLAAPSDMRILVKANDDLDIGADGLTPGTVDITYVDVTFPAALAGIAAVAFPVIEANMPARLGGDLATVALVDLSGGALAGAYVDILRYGKI
jgi:hypothetical protein